ncbi:unnamed protein product [Miscanthus lutarioriparius]|uniref:mannan endo-1,4-beta-mannosidase n=1 Tax=Miscanthus lutarioriparius TaxID=422564 RepID=A0A811R9A5_9POAL|nr:unnamed protein product [Miscanthus lutarioriparius]CAD6266712.1 unnamed protein product [Miscanthus lutarioriparius]
MRLRSGALALLLLLFVHAGGQEQRAAEARGDAFVRVLGTRFVHNGKPLFVSGFNTYWLMNLGADQAKHGIKMILSLVNYYHDYGGRKQYVDWAKNQGQNIPSDDAFFTNPVIKGFYMNHIKAILTRVNTLTGVAYKDDPTIMAWELMNEPRCQCDVTCPTIFQSWITEMAAHVKSIDGNHLLDAGLEGFYGLLPPLSRSSMNPLRHDKMGIDFIANNQVPGVNVEEIGKAQRTQ